MDDRTRRNICVGLLLAVMLVAGLTNLGNRFLWVDESLTALLGRNTLRFGYPTAWDGVNLATTTNGNCFNSALVYIKDNWIPYYMAAAAQLVGSDTYILRVPFVLAGVLSAYWLWLLARRLIGDNWGSVLTLAFYALSVPVLLFIRTVRYYSPGLLFVVLTMYCYVRATERNAGSRWWMALAASAILLFHSMYMFFMVTMITLAVAYVVFDRDRRSLGPLALSVLATAAGTLPWFMYSRAFSSQVENQLTGLPYFWLQVTGYLWQIQAYYLPFLTLGAIWLVLVLTGVRRRRWQQQTGPDGIPLWVVSGVDAAQKREQARERVFSTMRVARNLWLMIGQVLITIVVISAFSHYYNNRFLMPALPACYLLLGAISYGILRRDRIVGQVVVLLLLTTNILGVLPYFAINWTGVEPAAVQSVVKPPVPFFRAGWNSGSAFIQTLDEYLQNSVQVESYPLEFLFELTNDHDDATEGIIRFMWTYARPGDTVFVMGGDHASIPYYTGLRVVNRLDPRQRPWPLMYHSYPHAAPFQHLTDYPYRHVDWVVARGIGLEDSPPGRFIWEDDSLFQRITIVDYPDSMDVPEIWVHRFRIDYQAPPVYIYLNRNTDREVPSVVGKSELEPERGMEGL